MTSSIECCAATKPTDLRFSQSLALFTLEKKNIWRRERCTKYESFQLTLVYFWENVVGVLSRNLCIFSEGELYVLLLVLPLSELLALRLNAIRFETTPHLLSSL